MSAPVDGRRCQSCDRPYEGRTCDACRQRRSREQRADQEREQAEQRRVQEQELAEELFATQVKLRELRVLRGGRPVGDVSTITITAEIDELEKTALRLRAELDSVPAGIRLCQCGGGAEGYDDEGDPVCCKCCRYLELPRHKANGTPFPFRSPLQWDRLRVVPRRR